MPRACLTLASLLVSFGVASVQTAQYRATISLGTKFVNCQHLFLVQFCHIHLWNFDRSRKYRMKHCWWLLPNLVWSQYDRPFNRAHRHTQTTYRLTNAVDRLIPPDDSWSAWIINSTHYQLAPLAACILPDPVQCVDEVHDPRRAMSSIHQKCR